MHRAQLAAHEAWCCSHQGFQAAQDGSYECAALERCTHSTQAEVRDIVDGVGRGGVNAG